MGLRPLLLPWDIQPQQAVEPSDFAQPKKLWSLASAPRRGSLFGLFASEVSDPDVVAWQYGRAWDFDGSSSYVDLGAPPAGPITCIALVNFAGAATSTFPFASRENSLAGNVGIDALYTTTASGTILARCAVGGVSYQTTSKTGLNDGKYHVIAVQHDEADLSLYVDGVFIAAISAPGSMGAHAQSLRIANRNATYFGGQVADLAAFNVALDHTLEEIRTPQDYYDKFFAPRSIWVPVSAGGGSTPLLSFPTLTSIGMTTARPRVSISF